MKKLFSCLALVLFLGLLPISLAADPDQEVSSKSLILIVSSYSPDTKRVSDFFTEFENCVLQNDKHSDVILHYLSCTNINDAHRWIQDFEDLMEEYKNQNLQAVILLGQEAWSTYLSSSKIHFKCPVLMCYGSQRGIDVSSFNGTREWYPPSEIMTEKSKDKENFTGGILCRYDIAANIDLMLQLYPKISNILFVTDNSYGGISLQALIKKEKDNYPALKFTMIDSRKYSTDEAIEIIKNSSPSSAILLGTWKVDREGKFEMSSSITRIIDANPILPVFSISGTGFGAGNRVIGGYMPIYNYSPSRIYHMIEQYYSEGSGSLGFDILESHYYFDKLVLTKEGIRDYSLPKGSDFLNQLEETVRIYRNIIIIAILLVIALFVMFSFLLRSYSNNRKLSKEMQLANIDLIEAKERAEESDKLKSSFLANMSHEIRTPLNSIVGFSSLLCEDDLSKEERKEYEGIIKKNSESLLKLINDILDISRLESAKMKFSIRPVNIVDLCSKAMGTIAPLHKEGIEYLLDVPFESYIINTDEIRVLQVLVNFLTNSGKFTNNGFIKLTLEINEGLGKVYFIVTDTGCGISPDKRNLIFSRFEKVDEFQQGFGLGLAISKQIALKLGGDIYLEDGYNNGTKIIFEHPIVLINNDLPSSGGGVYKK